MTKIILTGAAGRMGKTLVKLILADQQIRLIGAVDAATHPSIGKDIGEIAGPSAAGIKLIADLKEIISGGDVIIDFSTPAATTALLEIANSNKKAVVIGTTGFTEEEQSQFAKFSKQIPIVLSPNMSIGVNLLWKLTELAAQTLGGEYRPDIVEEHHVHKKDAPSGTAKKLLEIVSQTLGVDAQSIPVQSIREGEIVGNHTISFKNKDQQIEITHRAFTREIFAQGAIFAAKWILDKRAGLYNMQDVLF